MPLSALNERQFPSCRTSCFVPQSREQTAVDTGLIIPPRTWDKATLLHLSIPPQTRIGASWPPNQASSAVLGVDFALC